MGGGPPVGGGVSPFYWSVIILTLIYNTFACLSFREAAVPTGCARYSAIFAVYMAMNIVYQGYFDVYFNGLSPSRAWIWTYFLFFIVNNVMFYRETQAKAAAGEQGTKFEAEGSVQSGSAVSAPSLEQANNVLP